MGAADAADQDRAVVQQVLAGDLQAYALLVDRHRHWVVNLAYQLVGSVEDAEDVAQEAFVQAYDKLRQLRRQEAFGGWLRKIVVHQALRRRRALARQRPAQVDLPTPCGVAATDTGLAVQQVLACLPETLVVVLVLRELHGLSYQEIARTLGVPIGTVRSRLHAARQAFRRLWQGEG
jgi:RNA polymerase sigma-70 factor (ECF subfamily)